MRMQLTWYMTNSLVKCVTGAPFHQRFFVCISNSMDISPCCNYIAGHQVAVNVCTCHAQNFVVITSVESRWGWKEISNEYKSRWTKTLVKREPGLVRVNRKILRWIYKIGVLTCCTDGLSLISSDPVLPIRKLPSTCKHHHSITCCIWSHNVLHSQWP